MSGQGLLAPYRILDLTDETGFLCGQMLAQLGAEVIKVEPPSGDSSRCIGPYYQDSRHPERSLFWFAYNNGKKGVTVDLTNPEGRDLFCDLVKKSHAVIECSQPGTMERLGLGYQDMRKHNPALVMTSISGFGQSGPQRDYVISDLVAMSPFMYLTGDQDRPPARISFPQSYCHTSGEAAVGTLIALYHAACTGQGQLVDVSVQACSARVTLSTVAWWEINSIYFGRQGCFRSGLSSGSARQRVIWPCKDGCVSFTVLGGASGANTNEQLVRWMDEEGLADDFLKGIDWKGFDLYEKTQQFYEQLESRMEIFFLRHTVAELYQGAFQRRMLLYPVATMRELAHYPQLEARDYWRKVDHPELETSITYPGPWIAGNLEPCKMGRRAPLIGEDNAEIYQCVLGLSPDEIERMRAEAII